MAFMVAGAVPLLAYVLPLAPAHRPVWSTVFTFGAMFLLGALVAAVAFGAGAAAAALIGAL
jgi:hypothetical protein